MVWGLEETQGRGLGLDGSALPTGYTALPDTCYFKLTATGFVCMHSLARKVIIIIHTRSSTKYTGTS